MEYTLRQVLAVTAGLAMVIAPASALPTAAKDFVVHETRAPTGTVSGTHMQWKRGMRVDPDAIVPLKIGLVQSNLEHGADRLMEVSDPLSKYYGKHLSEEEVHDLFAPSEETLASVHSWLVEMGVDSGKIKQYQNKGWLSVDLPASQIEKMFMTQYHEHEREGVVKIGCDDYSVPRHLSPHIDYIVPGIKLSAPMKKRTISGEEAAPYRVNPKTLPPYKITPNVPGFKPVPVARGNPATDTSNCANGFTSACYRAIYNIPANQTAVAGQQPAIFETGDTYAQGDIDSFMAKYNPWIPKGTAPKLQSVNGGQAPVSTRSEQNTGESDIDIDIIQSLIWPQTMILYQSDDEFYSTQGSGGAGFLNTFLDALDGSYCNYTAFGITGDSPGIDPSYPDHHSGGYNKPEMCGTYTPAKVISISYGEGEVDVPKNYLSRQCNEWMKLGLQGTTVLVASGDSGVGSHAGDGTNSGCIADQDGNEVIFNPGNPVACPYLTAVGATQLEPGTTITDPEGAMNTSLPQAPFFSSGGGFANYFPIPSYQQSAVSAYFANSDPGYPYYTANSDASNVGENGGLYNRAGRGIPDVSANGANFLAFTQGQEGGVLGTSLAAPLWAAIITLINQERASAGKGSVGFINPVLYANPSALTDITLGGNPNCQSDGFTAVEGWDPVTGLGTPKYPDLLKLWLSLD